MRLRHCTCWKDGYMRCVSRCRGARCCGEYSRANASSRWLLRAPCEAADARECWFLSQTRMRPRTPNPRSAVLNPSRSWRRRCASEGLTWSAVRFVPTTSRCSEPPGASGSVFRACGQAGSWRHGRLRRCGRQGGSGRCARSLSRAHRHLHLQRTDLTPTSSGAGSGAIRLAFRCRPALRP